MIHTNNQSTELYSESNSRMTLEVVKGKWCDLPVDLVNVIDDHVVLYHDKVRIRALSQIWNSCLPKLPDKQVPWLLHPLEHDDDATHGLYNPLDKKVYPLYIPEATNKLFRGSSYGWIATVEGIASTSPIDIYLINPLSGNRIKLPPRSEFPDVVEYHPTKQDEEFILRYFYDDSCPIYHDPTFDPNLDDRMTLTRYYVCARFTYRILLSSAPSDDCIIVAIHGNSDFLAWTKCNAEKWTHCPGLCDVEDIIFEDSKLYAIDIYGCIYALENIGSDNNYKLTTFASRLPQGLGFGRNYLALYSDGSLLVAVRQIDRQRAKRTYETTGFKLYKFDFSDSSLTEVNDIGGDVLFLGAYGENKLVSSRNLQGSSGVKQNCIYFTDCMYLDDVEEVNKKSDADIGIFNLEDKTVQPVPGLHQHFWPRPVWMNVD